MRSRSILKRRSMAAMLSKNIHLACLVVGVVAASEAIERELADVRGVGGARELRRFLDAGYEARLGQSLIRPCSQT